MSVSTASLIAHHTLSHYLSLTLTNSNSFSSKLLPSRCFNAAAWRLACSTARWKMKERGGVRSTSIYVAWDVAAAAAATAALLSLLLLLPSASVSPSLSPLFYPPCRGPCNCSSSREQRKEEEEQRGDDDGCAWGYPRNPAAAMNQVVVLKTPIAVGSAAVLLAYAAAGDLSTGLLLCGCGAVAGVLRTDAGQPTCVDGCCCCCCLLRGSVLSAPTHINTSTLHTNINTHLSVIFRPHTRKPVAIAADST